MRFPLPRSGPPRVVAATTAIALATGAAGWLIGAQVQSPADAAAAHRPPPASLITVAVQERVLTATLAAQGTVTYGRPQPITLTGAVATGTDSAVAPLVTKAPVAGRTLREGDVLLEVSGRPVFVLTGKVPMYRTLTRSSTGDDVRQLRAALRRLLPGRRVPAKGPLDDRALRAVGTWYGKRGYEAIRPSVAQRTQLRQLQQAVANAKLAAGKPGGSKQAVADADADLAEFSRTYGISIASGEIIFLPRLPVRLTTVTVKAGAPASGAVGTVADPALVVNGDVATDDADLLKPGMAATLEHNSGTRFAATLKTVGAPVTTPAGGDVDQPAKEGDRDAPATGTPIRLTPKDPAKLKAYAGQSFKITVTVGGTGSAVLAVPVAALSTASDGQARVTVQDATGAVRDVAVEAGLTTDGYVEVTPTPRDALRAGDRVVVGVQ